jgi:eukaryotic-like serine/threonine-protein kinase
MQVQLARVEAIFAEALDRRDAAARLAYLDEACSGDTELRARVAALLTAHEDAGSFLMLPVGSGSTNPFVELSEKPGTIIGRFKLLEQIGEGGFGVVFMAQQEEPVRRLVALKIIKLGMDTRQVVARFEAERQALAVMDHPNVARVLDGGTTDAGRPYFVMELVKGAPITEYCDKNNFNIPQRLELFSQVCQAVQHAHQKGLIHRDIKPTNVLVMTEDERPVAKVIDFGVAKAMQVRLTEKTLFTDFRQLVGTPAYMSPEQAAGGLDIDTRSDVYSLGVLLYELLTGSPPLNPKELRAEAFAEIQRMICEVELPPPSSRLSALADTLPSVAAQRSIEPRKLTTAVRGELDWIVMRCLEKDRKRRYETPSALARDIERYLHDEPVHACSPSAVYRIRKFIRRNRIAIAAAGMVLLLIVSAGGGIGWALRDRSLRQAALEQGVVAALGEVEAWYEREDWTEAMANVKQAERLVSAGEHSPALAARVNQWRAELEIIGRLDEIVLSNADGSQWDASFAINTKYEREFRLLGIDIDALTLEEAANRIRACRIREQLTQALDHWAQFRLNVSYDEKTRKWVKPVEWCRRPLAVARAADPNEFNGRVRLAIEKWELKQLVSLAELPAARNLPVSTLRLAARELYYDQDPQYRDKAREILKRAQAAHPNDFWINFTIANHLAMINGTRVDDQSGPNSTDEAIRYVTAAMALRPHNARVRILLGQLLLRSGRLEQGTLDEAEEICRKAVEVQADQVSNHNNLGDVLYLQKKFDQAADCYRKAIVLAPDSKYLYPKLGFSLQGQGKIEEARLVWRKASEVAENDASSLNQLAWILATTPHPQYRDPRSAVELAEKAAELAPWDGAIWNTLGVANFRAGDWQRAVEALNKSIELRACGDASDWILLAMAHWQLNHSDQARKWYDKSIEWMDKNAPNTDELHRIRPEGPERLGIETSKPVIHSGP